MNNVEDKRIDVVKCENKLPASQHNIYKNLYKKFIERHSKVIKYVHFLINYIDKQTSQTEEFIAEKTFHENVLHLFDENIQMLTQNINLSGMFFSSFGTSVIIYYKL